MSEMPISKEDRRGKGMSGPRFRAAVITVSDRVHAGVYEDKSGPAAVAGLTALGFVIGGVAVVPDEAEQISSGIARVVAEGGFNCDHWRNGVRATRCDS